MKTNKMEWFKVEDVLPSVVRNSYDFIGYAESDPIVLHVVGGLKGSYLDFGKLYVTVDPQGLLTKIWRGQNTTGDFEHLILGWSPLPALPAHFRTSPHGLCKALVSTHLISDTQTECVFKDMDGVETTQVLNVTLFAICQWLLGATIQNAMPTLAADEREMFITGFTPEKWEQIFS